MAWVVLVAAALALWLWCGPTWRGRSLPDVPRAKPWLIGHRGMRTVTMPENVIPAFREALEAGLDGLETDVQRSADGQLVLVHDLDVELPPLLKGGAPWRLPVDRAVLSELRAVVPQLALLSELLDLVRAYPGTLLNLEIKTLRLLPWRLAWDLADAVRSAGLGDRVIVSSFNPFALLLLRLRAPGLRTAYLWVDRPDVPRLMRLPWPAALLHVDAMHPEHVGLGAAQVRAWQARGLLVNVWTVNQADGVRRARELGVDAIMADDPHALLHAAGRTAAANGGDHPPAGAPATPQAG